MKNIFKQAVLNLIEIYQKAVSPWLGKRCRFEPTCSAFARMAVEKHGLIKGGFFSLKRISKCHPWHKPEVDLP